MQQLCISTHFHVEKRRKCGQGRYGGSAYTNFKAVVIIKRNEGKNVVRRRPEIYEKKKRKRNKKRRSMEKRRNVVIELESRFSRQKMNEKL